MREEMSRACFVFQILTTWGTKATVVRVPARRPSVLADSRFIFIAPRPMAGLYLFLGRAGGRRCCASTFKAPSLMPPGGGFFLILVGLLVARAGKDRHPVRFRS